jgi:hypothetical protein
MHYCGAHAITDRKNKAQDWMPFEGARKFGGDERMFDDTPSDVYPTLIDL